MIAMRRRRLLARVLIVLAPVTPATAQGARPPAVTDSAIAWGRHLFHGSANCAVCHGDDGKGGHTGGAPLDKVADFNAAIQTVTAGRNNMPSFRSAFTPEQVRDVSAYVVQTLAAGSAR